MVEKKGAGALPPKRHYQARGGHKVRDSGAPEAYWRQEPLRKKARRSRMMEGSPDDTICRRPGKDAITNDFDGR